LKKNNAAHAIDNNVSRQRLKNNIQAQEQDSFGAMGHWGKPCHWGRRPERRIGGRGYRKRWQIGDSIERRKQYERPSRRFLTFLNTGAI